MRVSNEFESKFKVQWKTHRTLKTSKIRQSKRESGTSESFVPIARQLPKVILNLSGITEAAPVYFVLDSSISNHLREQRWCLFTSQRKGKPDSMPPFSYTYSTFGKTIVP